MWDMTHGNRVMTHYKKNDIWNMRYIDRYIDRYRDRYRDRYIDRYIDSAATNSQKSVSWPMEIESRLKKKWCHDS